MDIGFARIFVVVVSFLGITALLITFFCADPRWVQAQDVRAVDVPSEWNGINLRNMNLTDSKNYTLVWNIQGEDLWLGGHHIYLIISAFDGNYEISLRHISGFLGLWQETMRWYSQNGTQQEWWWINTWRNGLLDNMLDDEFERYDQLQYTVKSDWPFQIISLFYFNQTEYSHPSDAWHNSALQIFLGITWEYMSTTYNAWDLVGMMLFFQMPETNAYINALIVIPIWAAIALFAAIIILEFIKAIKPFG